jgi:nitroimidazol reductase NimA-like FMN-containing flavoprotein (pyridoxamine 5'-phosphate oxidase superfamily)
MARTMPTTELDARFSSANASPTPWEDGRRQLEDASVFWLSTVRSDGRPHVTPLIAVWLDGALHFCTGPSEQKAKNLARNPHCILLTGSNAYDDGLDVVVEGDAVQVTDETKLRLLAEAYVSKYGEDWRFDVRDGAFFSREGGTAPVYAVAPAKALGFAKGDYAQTRWRFDP